MTSPQLLIRQTDRHERAARTFGAVDERRRDLSALGGRTRTSQCIQRCGDELIVYDHADALFRRVVVDDCFVAPVAIVPKNERLRADLRAIGRPRFRTVCPVARRPSFVVDWRDLPAGALDKVDNGEELVRLARQIHGPRVDSLGAGVRRRHRVRLGFELFVPEGPFYRVAAVSEHAFHPF